ncbi:MAG: ATP-binding protein [Muribaculaceae bacterium]|nr:ATP-binding protein [Muribaculaceae bacterium]
MFKIKRDLYLNKLISRRHNGRIKVVTGIRRSGKTYLLFTLFNDWLKENGVVDSQIIQINLEDRRNKRLRDPDVLLEYIDSQMQGAETYYIMIDEIQHVPEFEDVLNSYLQMRNADVYVTGSNARFLSKDVITTFRGRGDQVHIYPLSYAEYHTASNRSPEATLQEYMLYGGLPQIVFMQTDEEKSEFLKNIYEETYIRDIKDRYIIKQEEEFEILLNILSSTVGSLTNPQKLANTFASNQKHDLSALTIKKYLDYICDSFIVEKASRYDVKGKKYIDTPYKYYFADTGLKNARINFRQNDDSHTMENIIYNELRRRGFNVDVGVVPVVFRDDNGRQARRQYEIDFVCNLGSKRYYIQSAYRMETEAKVIQEELSLRNVSDSFKKIIVLGQHTPIRRNDAGITTMSIYDFLLKENSLEL